MDLVRSSSRPRVVIAGELGLSDATLARWMTDNAEQLPEPELTCSERAELIQLRSEKREWTIEREILKKGMAWWVKEQRG